MLILALELTKLPIPAESIRLKSITDKEYAGFPKININFWIKGISMKLQDLFKGC